MSNEHAQFVKWGAFRVRDKDYPDTLEFKVIGADTTESEYSICTRLLRKEVGNWVEVMLPLKAHNSANASLLNQWTKAAEQGRLKAGKSGKILTWLDTSKNGNPIRRFRLVI